MNSSNDVSSSSFPRRTGVAVNSSLLTYPSSSSSASGVSPSESDAMDSSSIQFSGTCVASKLLRYCRRSLARRVRSADDIGSDEPGGRGGSRIRRSRSGIGKGGIFSGIFNLLSGLNGPPFRVSISSFDAGEGGLGGART